MRRHWPLCLALVAVGFGLFYGVFTGGLWAPYELRTAELARRIAVNLLGGHELQLPAADNSLPIRADLGRGELPFTFVALGFRLFGLSPWAGRLSLALWAVAGLLALYAALTRLTERRLALYAVLVLASTPLYFLQARTLLGDAVTLASFAIAWSGLSVACLCEDVSPGGRAGFALLGALGAYAGFWCRGPIVSVAVPALAVAVAGLLRRPFAAPARWATLGAGVVGVLALVLGVSGASIADKSGDYSVLVGTSQVTPPALPTFDVGLGELTHAAFPWSAAAPLVLALLVTRGGAPSTRATVNAAALGLAASLFAASWLAPTLGVTVLPAVCCLAVLVAAALRAVEAGRLGSPLLALLTAALTLLIGFDLHENPDKLLTGFGLRGAVLPESLESSASKLWLGGACCLALVAASCLYERGAQKTRAPRFERAEYVRVLSALNDAFAGNLVFGLLLLEAALVGFLVLCGLADRVALPQLQSFGSFSRKLAALGALALPLSPLAVIGALALRDATRWLFDARSHGVTRAQGVLLAFAALGGAASLGFYPSLARQVSPTQAFESFRRMRQPGDMLGVLGELSGAARYQGVPDAESFDRVDEAFAFLTESESARRFLVLRQSDLAELNAQFRALRHRNLPILEAGSSEVRLGSNLLRAGERSQNPLDLLVLDAAPAIARPLDAVLDEKLQVLGFSLRSSTGELETSLVPARAYQLSFYFKVLEPLGDEAWQVFLHIDGFQRRFNADHEPLGGRYPQQLWRAGDVLVDTTEVRLEPNFSAGPYHLYVGLFSGDRRLPVSRGPQSDDRIVAGVLQVR